MDFVVLAKFAIVAIFPNVATAAIEERVVTTAIRELETDVLSLRQGGLGLKQWCPPSSESSEGEGTCLRSSSTLNFVKLSFSI